MGNSIQVDQDAVISEPLEFHEVHADNVEISADHRRARRTDGQRGLCFSQRPILQNEVVCIRISESSGGRSHKGISMRFGFTAVDPATDNRNTSSDAMIAGHGYWVKPVSDSVAKRGSAVFFFLNESGEVIHGRKDKDYGVLFSGVRTGAPLWVVIDLAGSASSIEFLESRLSSSQTETSNKTKAAVAKFRRHSRLSRSTDALSTSSADAARQSQDDLHSSNGGTSTATMTTTDRRMARNLSMPNHSPTPPNDGLNSLESSSIDVDRDSLTNRIVPPSSRRPRATDVTRSVDSEAIVRSSTRSTNGVDAHPSRRTSRHSSLTPTLAGGSGLADLVGLSVNGGSQIAAGLSGSVSTPDALASMSLSGSLDLANNHRSVDQAQTTAASSASRSYQRHAANVNEPMPFHRTTRGRNITLSEDGTTASRVEDEYCNAYVFTERPLLPDDELVIQVEDISNHFTGGLTVGLTTNDPGGLRRTKLPDDPHKLLDRPEYWVVHRDIHTRPKVGNELSFHVTKAGIIRRSNPPGPSAGGHGTNTNRSSHRHAAGVAAAEADRPTTSRSRHVRGDRQTSTDAAATGVMTASSSQSATVSVERSSQNTSANAPAASSTAGTTVAPPSERPRHARSSRGPSAVPRPVTSNLVSDLLSDTPALLPPPLIPLPPGSDPSVANDLVMLSDDVPVGGASGSTRTKTDSGKSSRKRDDAECAICLEKEPDSALYPCGHMCMCYECAVSVKNQRSALCPMCRQPIVDILRIYRN